MKTAGPIRDLVGYGGSPPSIVWPGGSRLALSVLVHFEEGAEPSIGDGDVFSEAASSEWTTEGSVAEGSRRDLQVELMWEYGSRQGIWRILRVLAAFKVQATFLCSGRALERNPEAARAIVAEGHEICAHGYRHVPYNGLSVDEQRADIRRCLAAITLASGSTPRGWCSRSPTLETRDLLRETTEIVYDCDSYGDELPFVDPSVGRQILTIPYPISTSDHRFWPMPGVAGFTTARDFFDVLIAGFNVSLAEAEAGKTGLFSLAIRLRISGRPARAYQLERFLAAATTAEHPVWVATLGDVAQYWIANAQ